MTELSLVRHPALPASDGVRSVRVHVERARPAAGLKLTYEVHGDIADVLVPESRLAERTDRLWEQTCFEVFSRGIDENGYREFNFSPSSQWAAYGFERYRAGMHPVLMTRAPVVQSRSTTHRLSVSASVTCDDAWLKRPQTHYCLALCAVLKTRSGATSYWALTHCADKPDFHHPDSFIFNMESHPS